MSVDPADAAASIIDQFPEDVSLDSAAVEGRIQVLVDDYAVPMDEAKRAARHYFLEETGLTFDDLDGTGGSTHHEADYSLATIDEADEWLTVTAAVVELWDPTSEKIDQVGLLGDESGTCKFTKWATAANALPTLETGRTYRFENVITDEYQGRYSVSLNSATDIAPVDVDIDVGSETVTATGALVALQSGSGLIERCGNDECTRVLQNGRCSEHGPVEGTFDLRLKAVLDDGHEAVDVLFDREAIEAVTGMSLADATDIAMDALDREAVRDDLAAQVRGRYYEVEGSVVGQYLLVETCERLGPAAAPDVATLQERIAADGE